MNYLYTYLLMNLLLLIVWLFLFAWRKDTRKEMLVMSIIFALAGPMADFIYTQDWWRPLTLTGTRVGIEAILFGFVIGGISSVLYETIFKKKVNSARSKNNKRENFNLFLILGIVAALFLSGFFILKLNSLLSTILALVISIMIIYIKRRDLIINSVISGLLTVIVAWCVYAVLEILTPGWIKSFWYFKNIPDIVLYNMPIDDLLWYFLTGSFIGPLYEYWKNLKTKNE